MARNDSLSEKTGVVVFARILTTVVDLLTAVAIIQILSKTDFAIIGYLLMIHEVARNLAVLGFPESIFYYFERVSKDARWAFVVQTCSLLLAAALVAALAVFGVKFIAPYLLGNWPEASVEAVKQFLPVMALIAFFEIPTWPTTNILLAADRQKDSAWYEILTSMLSFVALVVPLWMGYSLETALYGLAGYAIVRFVGSFIWIWLVLPEKHLSGSEISVKSQVSFSVPLGMSSLVNKINRYIDKFVVSLLLIDTAYAEYSVGAQEVPIIRVIPFAVGSVLISRYVSLQMESKKEELLELWYKGIRKVSLLVLPLTVMVIVVAGDLISLLFESEGTSYEAAVLPFQIYNLIILIRITHYGSILQAFGDTKGVLLMSINLLAANLVLSIPMTYFFGIIGTALSTLIANIYNWYMILRRIGGHMDLPARKVLPFPFFFRVLGVSVLAGVIVWSVRHAWIGADQDILGLSVGMTVFLLLFAVMGTVLKVISSEDWQQFRNWISLKFLWN